MGLLGNSDDVTRDLRTGRNFDRRVPGWFKVVTTYLVVTRSTVIS